MSVVPNFDTLRFFVIGDDHRPRSSTWFVTGRGRGVYLTPSVLGRALKLSFHPAGGSQDGNDSQYGLERDEAKRQRDLGFEPFRPFRWKRPATPERGAVHAASILFPTEHLGVAGPSRSPGKTKLALQAAPPGQVTEVGLFFSRSPPAALEPSFLERGWRPLVAYDFPGGEFVSVAARHSAYPELATMPALPTQWQPLSGATTLSDEASLRMVLVSPPAAEGEPIYLIEVGPVEATDQGAE